MDNSIGCQVWYYVEFARSANNLPLIEYRISPNSSMQVEHVFYGFEKHIRNMSIFPRYSILGPWRSYCWYILDPDRADWQMVDPGRDPDLM